MAGFAPAGSLMEYEGMGGLANNQTAMGSIYGQGLDGAIWNSWNQGMVYAQTGGSVNVYYQQATWQTWNTGYVTGNTATVVNYYNDQVWYNWNLLNSQGMVYDATRRTIIDNRSEEEKAAAAAQLVEQQRLAKLQRDQEEETRKAAVAKARETLKSTLTKDQQDQLDKHNSFELQVGANLYRVQPGRRVQRLDPTTKKVRSEFCIHPANSYELPAEDTALSQKLLLEANEKEFLRLANETRVA